MSYYPSPNPPSMPVPRGAIRQPSREGGRSPADGGYFSLGRTVGRDSRNEREDVLRIQTLLAHAGYFDMERTEGPTGWYGKPLELGIRKFQRDNGLAVDGYIEPSGETLSALERQFGPIFASHQPPSLALIDEHHERRSRGEPGLLNTERGKGMPFGVPLMTMEIAEPRPPLITMRKAKIAPRTSLQGDGLTDSTIQLAARSRDDLIRNPKPNAPGLPDVGGGGPIGVGTILKGAAEAGAAAGKRHEVQELKDFVAQSRISLELGITEGFGRVERRESENTTESGRVVRDACLDALATRGLTAFKHVAGGRELTEDGRDIEKAEWTVKDGMFHSAGGGHSLPDLVFSDGKVFFAINTATESGSQLIPREISSFDRLLKNLGRWVAGIISKKGANESWEDYKKRADDVCNETIDRMLQKEREEASKPQDSPQAAPAEYPPSP